MRRLRLNPGRRPARAAIQALSAALVGLSLGGAAQAAGTSGAPPVTPDANAPLTEAQGKLINLVAYIQVARDTCHYQVDTGVLRLVAEREGITFQRPVERQASQQGFRIAQQAFAGMRRSVECSYALVQYGPDGSIFKGLLAKRPRR